MRAWRTARTRTGNGAYTAKCSHIFRAREERAFAPDRSGAAETFCLRIRPDARAQGHKCRLRHREKDFDVANVVRVLLGDVETGREEIIELACNLDDMTPEELAFAMDELFRLGALDVFY